MPSNTFGKTPLFWRMLRTFRKGASDADRRIDIMVGMCFTFL